MDSITVLSELVLWLVWSDTCVILWTFHRNQALMELGGVSTVKVLDFLMYEAVSASYQLTGQKGYYSCMWALCFYFNIFDQKLVMKDKKCYAQAVLAMTDSKYQTKTLFSSNTHCVLNKENTVLKWSTSFFIYSYTANKQRQQRISAAEVFMHSCKYCHKLLVHFSDSYAEIKLF